MNLDLNDYFQDMLPHLAHRLSIIYSGDFADPDCIEIKCSCGAILMRFEADDHYGLCAKCGKHEPLDVLNLVGDEAYCSVCWEDVVNERRP